MPQLRVSWCLKLGRKASLSKCALSRNYWPLFAWIGYFLTSHQTPYNILTLLPYSLEVFVRKVFLVEVKEVLCLI